jgi:hypothetical protein
MLVYAWIFLFFSEENRSKHAGIGANVPFLFDMQGQTCQVKKN